MNNFITYQLESAIILAFFYAVYRAFFRNETFFTINRFILLGSLPVSFLLPLLNFSSGNTALLPLPSITLPVIDVAGTATGQATTFSASPLLYIYLAGVIALVIHAVYNISAIAAIKRKAEVRQTKDNKIYLVKKGHSFSFFRNIFLNPHNQTEKELEQIKEHEKVHVNHYHSLDALLIHLVIIFQWFNPFAWLLKYAIYENHEFIADRETSRKVSEYKYQDLLLRQAAGIPLSTLVHPFNQISLKRRFKMFRGHYLATY
jgi:beta-lactamase regulating signal transducer with metallopeptidase domain